MRKLLFIVVFILIVCSAFRFASDLRHPNLLRANEVIHVGANFAGNISQFADAFDGLIDQSNARIRDLNDSAKKQNSYKDVLSWVSVSLTVLVTLLAAIAGINPQESQQPVGGSKRSRIVVAIAIIAALASGSQLFTDKLGKDAQTRISAAIELSNATALSRILFLRGKEAEDATKATSDLQQALLKASTL